jgi:F420-non-reducing hydrogenase iron-sulfur subunit
MKTQAEEATGIREYKPGFTPSLAIFHCRWCLPDSGELRKLFPGEVAARSVMLSINCSARMEAEFAIKALAEGFDGIMVLGCEIGECHYRTGNHRALKRLTVLRNMLSLAGIYPERLGIFFVSPFDQDTIKSLINSYIQDLVKLGAFK